jgi:tetratricopeptide (TPR) repeat protein
MVLRRQFLRRQRRWQLSALRLGALGRFLTAALAGLLLSSLLLTAPALTLRAAAQGPAAQPVPLLDDLGSHHYPISTTVALAQRYFDQGLILAYGFNHAEAARAFEAAIAADASCAMCYFGLAYVLGPNINAPMAPEAVTPAWQALQQAIALSPQIPAKEQALIQALERRYAADPNVDRAALNWAYADAIAQVHQQYPDDLEIATLYAEAIMDTMPWDYWEASGQPKPATSTLLSLLERVLAINPNHIGALHLYIHAVERERPELAEDEADRLLALVPGAGHLVHMPSHIYVRVGRYHDAVLANQAAIAADQRYLQAGDGSLYALAYPPHNYHFAWFGALMSGQYQVAAAAAARTAQVDPALMRRPDLAGSLQHYLCAPLYTQVRFSRWQEILATPAPAADLKYPTGVWHYSQGMALAATGQSRAAVDHLRALQALAADPELATVLIWGFNSTGQVLELAAAVLAGEVAAAQGQYSQAVAYLQRAVILEDQLRYTEPPDWYAPTRNLLGQVLLRAGRYSAAEAAFRADLAHYPENGWSLHGLAQSLRGQRQGAAAQVVQVRFETAWRYADTPLIAWR